LKLDSGTGHRLAELTDMGLSQTLPFPTSSVFASRAGRLRFAVLFLVDSWQM